MEWTEVTREDFEAYEEVRQSGVTNMLGTDVEALAGIDRDTHHAILRNYGDLCDKWPEVRDLRGVTNG
jgi:hypothetical protein